MNDDQAAVARACLQGAETDAMAFPAILGALMEAGFESYAVDFRRTTAAYYQADGSSLELATHKVVTPVAPSLDTEAMQAAIGEAQQQVPGYTYIGFCEKAAAAGCAGYTVSMSGRRALYIGRTAETYVEPLPEAD